MPALALLRIEDGSGTVERKDPAHGKYVACLGLVDQPGSHRFLNIDLGRDFCRTDRDHGWCGGR